MIASESDAAMVRVNSDIAHMLGMKTVAGGSEPEVLALLAEASIDYARELSIERPFPAGTQASGS